MGARTALAVRERERPASTALTTSGFHALKSLVRRNPVRKPVMRRAQNAPNSLGRPPRPLQGVGQVERKPHNYADYARSPTLVSTALDRICMSSKCSNQLS
jgi:hypothetical protein